MNKSGNLYEVFAHSLRCSVNSTLGNLSKTRRFLPFRAWSSKYRVVQIKYPVDWLCHELAQLSYGSFHNEMFCAISLLHSYFSNPPHPAALHYFSPQPALNFESYCVVGLRDPRSCILSTRPKLLCRNDFGPHRTYTALNKNGVTSDVLSKPYTAPRPQCTPVSLPRSC